MKRNLLMLGLLAALTPAGAADRVVGGPVVVNVSAKTATVVWLVQSGEAVLSTAGGADKSAPVLRGESTTFTGLTASTSYEYSVPGHDELKGSFKTPAAAGQDFEFVVYGDTRTRHDVHKTVIASVLQNAKPDFVVHTGDLVADGTDPALWPVFFDIEHELLRKTAFFPSLGNHERNARDYYDYLQVPKYYSFNWGNAHFSILDTDIGNIAVGEAAKQNAWKEQAQWLEEDLQKNQKQEFRFVAGHHPPMTAVSNRQGFNPQMTDLIPMFEQLHVTAAFFGHDHNYQHYLKNGIHYIVTGGGGAPLYDVDKPPEGITLKVARTENFVRVQVQGKVAHVVGITPDGTKLESFDIEGGSH